MAICKDKQIYDNTKSASHAIIVIISAFVGTYPVFLIRPRFIQPPKIKKNVTKSSARDSQLNYLQS